MPAGTRQRRRRTDGRRACTRASCSDRSWIGRRARTPTPGANCVYAHAPVAKGAGIELEPGHVLIASQPAAGDEEATRWFRPSDVCVGDGRLDVRRGLVGPGRRRARWRATARRTAGSCASRRAGVDSHAPKIDLSTSQGRREALTSPAVNVRALGFDALRAQGDEALPRSSAARKSVAVHPRASGLAPRAHGRRGAQAPAQAMKDADPQMAIAAFRALRRAREMPVEGRPDRDPPRRTRAASARRRRGPRCSTRAGRAKDPSLAVPREAALALASSWRIAIDREPGALDGRARRRSSSSATSPAIAGTSRRSASRFDAARGRLVRAGSTRSTAAIRSSWSERFAELAWRLHPRAAIPALVARCAGEVASTPAARKQAVDALAFSARRDGRRSDARPRARRARGRARARGVVGRAQRLDDLARLPPRATSSGRADSRTREMRWSSGILDGGFGGRRRRRRAARRRSGSSSTSGKPATAATGRTGSSRARRAATGERPLDEPRLGAARSRAGASVQRRPERERRAARESAARSCADGIGTHARLGDRLSRPGGRHALPRARRRSTTAARRRRRAIPTSSSRCGRTGAAIRERVDDAREVARRRVDATPTTSTPRRSAGRRSRRRARAPPARRREASSPPRATEARRAHIFANPDLSVRALATRALPAPAGDGAAADVDDVLALPGDRRARRARSSSATRRSCSTCHTFHGRGGDVGPDLSAIATKYGKPRDPRRDPEPERGDRVRLRHVARRDEGRRARERLPARRGRARSCSRTRAASGT